MSSGETVPGKPGTESDLFNVASDAIVRGVEEWELVPLPSLL
jgi:hypothetical protein